MLEYKIKIIYARKKKYKVIINFNFHYIYGLANECLQTTLYKIDIKRLFIKKIKYFNFQYIRLGWEYVRPPDRDL